MVETDEELVHLLHPSPVHLVKLPLTVSTQLFSMMAHVNAEEQPPRP
jgi:hypothetical protein